MTKQLKALLGSYDKINQRNCCSFLLVGDNGKEKLWEAAVCHAGLEYQPANEWHTLYTSYPLKLYSSYTKQFGKFLLEYPYRKWAKHIQLVLDNYGKYYFQLDLTKIPAQVVLNFCIASRFPVEKPELLFRWQSIWAEGVHPTLAWVLSGGNFSVLNGTLIDFCNFNQEHMPFYTQSLDIKRLIEGNPVIGNTQSYKKNPCGCTPTNAIWGETKSLRPLISSTVPPFCKQIQGHINEVLLQSS